MGWCQYLEDGGVELEWVHAARQVHGSRIQDLVDPQFEQDPAVVAPVLSGQGLQCSGAAGVSHGRAPVMGAAMTHGRVRWPTTSFPRNHE